MNLSSSIISLLMSRNLNSCPRSSNFGAKKMRAVPVFGAPELLLTTSRMVNGAWLRCWKRASTGPLGTKSRPLVRSTVLLFQCVDKTLLSRISFDWIVMSFTWIPWKINCNFKAIFVISGTKLMGIIDVECEIKVHENELW